MPLNKAKLNQDIFNILKSGYTQGEDTDPNSYFSTIAEKLSTAIDSYVRSGDVIGVQTIVAPGISATGTGTGANAGGPVVTAVTSQTVAPGQGTQSNIGKVT